MTSGFIQYQFCNPQFVANIHTSPKLIDTKKKKKTFKKPKREHLKKLQDMTDNNLDY